MNSVGPFTLYEWIHSKGPSASLALGGSASPSLSLSELIALSTDSKTTAANLDITNVRFNLSTSEGALPLRQAVAALFSRRSSKSPVSADDVLITNSTTGANLVAAQALLSPGDHVIATYPNYSPLVDNARGAGAIVGLWNLHPDRNWQPDVNELKGLVQKGKTKMIIINSPGNPTGQYLRKDVLQGIVTVAREIGAVVLCDEIFHPLYHFDQHSADDGAKPMSILDLADEKLDQIIVTGSVSKVWGLSGVRVGWLVTQNKEIMKKCLSMRAYIVHGLGVVDEIIATEALSERCRPGILERHLALAKSNLPILKEFGTKWEKAGKVKLTMPEAGTIAFVQFLGPDGQAVDDVAFCEELLAKEGLLLSPGSRCFGKEWKGFCRLHFNVPLETFQQGIEMLERFLGSGN